MVGHLIVVVLGREDTMTDSGFLGLGAAFGLRHPFKRSHIQSAAPSHSSAGVPLVG